MTNNLPDTSAISRNVTLSITHSLPQERETRVIWTGPLQTGSSIDREVRPQ